MIGVCVTTRGLVFTKALEALERNLEPYEHKIFYSYDLPIPESQNTLVEKALSEDCPFILFVEEDVVLPEEAVGKLLLLGADIACLDYGVEGWSCVTRKKETKEILWCGLGCTLVKREVFEKLEKPYFRIDKQLLLNDWPKETWIDANPQKTYGGQDIWFCMKAREKGFVIQQVPGECEHLKLEELGLKEINKGLHTISEKPKIIKHQEI